MWSFIPVRGLRFTIKTSRLDRIKDVFLDSTGATELYNQSTVRISTGYFSGKFFSRSNIKYSFC